MTPLQFVSDHIHVAGWSTVISFLSWVWWKSIRVWSAFEKARDRAVIVEQNVNLMATNHLHGIEKNITELNQKHDLTMDVLTESAKSLSDISTNIRILKDRGDRF